MNKLPEGQKRKRNFSFVLDQSIYDELQQLAEATESSVSRTVRILLKEGIERRRTLSAEAVK